MSFEWRGGQPVVTRVTTSTAGSVVPVPGRTSPHTQGSGTTTVTGVTQTVISKWVRLRNLSSTSGQNIRIYFDPADFTAANSRYLTLLPGDIVREPMEVNQIWVVSESGSPVLEFMALARRG